MPRADKPTGESRLEPQTAIPSDAFERTNDLLAFAMEHPVDFLGHCGNALGDVPDELLDDTDDSMGDLLPDYLDAIPMMQRIVRERFAGALCP